MSFSGKVVVVTGASTGIGAVIAISFAKEGAEVVLVGRNEDRLIKVAKQCDANGKKALIIKAEFNKEDETSTVIPKAAEHFGKIDILVNNAGLYKKGKIFDGSIHKTYDRVMLVNLTAPILLTTMAAPYLVKTKGSIVNISSVRAYDDIPYGISKAGLDYFTRAAALELGASGVRVNSINLGAVDTADIPGNEEVFESIGSRSALGKVAKNNEVAEFTLFLASDKAKSITGGNHNIDNGFVLKSTTLTQSWRKKID